MPRTVGGLGALAFGCGTTELGAHPRDAGDGAEAAEAMRIRLDGALGAARHRQGRGAAHHRGARRVRAARGHVVEYAGAAVRAMPIEQRMTLCNLNIEMGGRSGFVAPDEATFAWIAGRPFAPQGAQWDAALAHWRTLTSDDDAEFDREHVLDCAALEPQITWGTDPSQVVGISGRVPDPAALDPSRRAAWRARSPIWASQPGTPLAGLPVNRVFIGSCTNARLPDLQAAADMVRGPHVSPRRRRDGGAGLLDREARGGGRGPRPRVPRRRLLLGRVRLLDVRRRQWRPRRAGRAHRLDHQPQFREPPGPEGAHASGQPRDRRGVAPSPAASPTCGSSGGSA